MVAAHHTFFMEQALEEARRALRQGEFPVGCVIVIKEQVIATGFRRQTRGTRASEIHHAEMIALERLTSADLMDPAGTITLYTTMEPCLMCYGAILLSGIRKVVYAYEDVMGGGTGCDLTRLSPLYRSRPVVLVPNILREKSLSLLKIYFKDPRNRYWEGSLLARYTLSQ